MHWFVLELPGDYNVQPGSTLMLFNNPPKAQWFKTASTYYSGVQGSAGQILISIFGLGWAYSDIGGAAVSWVGGSANFG